VWSPLMRSPPGTQWPPPGLPPRHTVASSSTARTPAPARTPRRGFPRSPPCRRAAAPALALQAPACYTATGCRQRGKWGRAPPVASPPATSSPVCRRARQIAPHPRMAGDVASPRRAVEGALSVARTPSAWTPCVGRVEPAPRPRPLACAMGAGSPLECRRHGPASTSSVRISSPARGRAHAKPPYLRAWTGSMCVLVALDAHQWMPRHPLAKRDAHLFALGCWHNVSQQRQVFADPVQVSPVHMLTAYSPCYESRS